jgi:YesN/AraC family two-component response regulator
MKNILIADDHTLIRSGLRMVIDSMIVKADINEAWDAKTVMAKLKEKQFDLILLDIQMPATDSVVLMHWIQSFYPDTKILIVSQNPKTPMANATCSWAPMALSIKQPRTMK